MDGTILHVSPALVTWFEGIFVKSMICQVRLGDCQGQSMLDEKEERKTTIMTGENRRRLCDEHNGQSCKC